MHGRPFVDTNVLVYAVAGDGECARKAELARGVLRSGKVCLSTQILGEFYSAVTSARRADPMTHVEALAWVQMWKHHDVRTVTTEHVDLALDLKGRHSVGYYDALVLASARLAGCEVMFSEDLSHGHDYDGVRVENPFAEHKS